MDRIQLSKKERSAQETFAPADCLSAISLRLLERGRMLATAESCTGGLIPPPAGPARAAPSQWFERGFVSYSNAAKTDMLGVPARLIEQHGAVSQAVACAMAEGSLR